jgi:hypothetical protein
MEGPRTTQVGDVILRHHDAREAREIADELAAVYHEAYLGTPKNMIRSTARDRFIERFHGYTSAPGFELVTAHDGGRLAGYVFGYALPTGARWWNGLLDAVPERFTDETGTRTFALKRATCAPALARTWNRLAAARRTDEPPPRGPSDHPRTPR